MKDSSLRLPNARVLICGWFSYVGMGASAGDLMAAGVVTNWLAKHGIAYDLATAPPFEGDVELCSIEPDIYTHLMFVCGPFGNGWPVTDLRKQFPNCSWIGLNLSMLEDVKKWNPFDVLIERDSSRGTRPDLVFLSEKRLVDCVGRILVHPQKEYAKLGRHTDVNAAIDRLLTIHEVAIVDIDTRLDVNSTGLRSAAEVESLIARMDIVVTTRLHGTVLSLKNGVPVLALDPVAGGAKIKRQAKEIEWPMVFTPDEMDEKRLADAFAWCATEEARDKARSCAELAQKKLTGYFDLLLRPTISSE